MTPTREPKTTENRHGPRRGRANEVPPRINVTDNIRHDGDGAVEAEAASGCPTCDHDPIAALRQVLAERQEAWRAGCRVRRDALERAEFRDFAAGWELRGEYEAERGAA